MGAIVHSSLYLPEPVYEALRKTAFEERLKINDVVLEGIDLHCGGVAIRQVESLRVGKGCRRSDRPMEISS